MRRVLIWVLAMAAAGYIMAAAHAHAGQKLYSFTFGAWHLPRSSGDQIVTVPARGQTFRGYVPGCCIVGVMPATSFTIVGAALCNEAGDAHTWSMIGKTGFGDYLTTIITGPRCEVIWFPAGTGFQFLPGDELHVHTQSGTAHSVRATIWYTLP